MDIVEMGNKITDFFNNIKTIITEFIDFLPSEIVGILIPCIVLVCGLFIYRFLR